MQNRTGERIQIRNRTRHRDATAQRAMLVLSFLIFVGVCIVFVGTIIKNRKTFQVIKGNAEQSAVKNAEIETMNTPAEESIEPVDGKEYSSSKEKWFSHSHSMLAEVESRLLKQREDGYYVNVNGKIRIPLELYIMQVLGDTINTEYDLEVLKAQAIVMRSSLLSQAGANKEISCIKEDLQETPKWGETLGAEETKIIKAVLSTWGIVMVSNHREAVYASFHAMSNGRTRILKGGSDSKFKYLKSVNCRENLEAPDYISIHEIASQKTGKLGECIRDEQGYILWIKVNDVWISGEQFCREMGMESSDFEYRLLHKKYRFAVKGKGHGYGMDQYYGNVLAGQGKNVFEILLYFFDSVSFDVF